nr:PREDICTED: uncharacterized protein LOC109044550 [Bemisia tabaci]
MKRMFTTNEGKMMNLEFDTPLTVYQITSFNYHCNDTKAHELAARLGVAIKATEDSEKPSTSKKDTSTSPKVNANKNGKQPKGASAVPDDSSSKKKKSSGGKGKGPETEKPSVEVPAVTSTTAPPKTNESVKDDFETLEQQSTPVDQLFIDQLKVKSRSR